VYKVLVFFLVGCVILWVAFQKLLYERLGQRRLDDHEKLAAPFRLTVPIRSVLYGGLALFSLDIGGNVDVALVHSFVIKFLNIHFFFQPIGTQVRVPMVG